MRCVASAALASGNWPIWSADTTLVMFGAAFCWLSARASPSAIGAAVTVTASSSTNASRSSISSVTVRLAATVTGVRTVWRPRKLTAAVRSPAGTPASWKRPSPSVTACRTVPSTSTTAPGSGPPRPASTMRPDSVPEPVCCAAAAGASRLPSNVVASTR